MKNFRIPFILLLPVLLVACKKQLLDTSPNYSIASSTMWTTDNLTDLGVSGVYNALRASYVIGGNGGGGWGLYATDSYGMTGQNYSSDAVTAGSVTSSSGLFSGTWTNCYEGISRANDAIANIPSKSPSDATKKSRYIAECKFLRAFYYFTLNRVFQGVPVYLTPTAFDQFTKPRSSADSVWGVITDDLTAAINEPNLPARYTAGNANYGHVTKGAAYALRGKVYLLQKKWDLAIADFQQVQSAGFNLYTGAGTNSYKMLFKAANEQSPEMIFAMQNVDAAGYGGDIPFFCGTRVTFGSCWDYFSPAPDLVDLYENTDGSKFDWNKVIPGYTAMTPAQREVYFIRDNATAAELSAASARGADITKYIPVGNEARILQAYANRDLRLTATVITPYSTYLGAPIGTSADLNYTLRWPIRDNNPPVQDIKGDAPVLSYFYYWYRKFVSEGSAEASARDRSPIDFPIIRYADVLLMWAEALNEKSGATQQGVDLVNQVRSRAGLASLQITNAALPTFVNGQSDFRDRIRNERRVEFVNEGINYFDELRWGTLKATKFYAGNGTKQIWGKVVVPYTWAGDQLYTWPVPLTVTQINPAVAKTTGWLY